MATLRRRKFTPCRWVVDVHVQVVHGIPQIDEYVLSNPRCEPEDPVSVIPTDASMKRLLGEYGIVIDYHASDFDIWNTPLSEITVGCLRAILAETAGTLVQDVFYNVASHC